MPKGRDLSLDASAGASVVPVAANDTLGTPIVIEKRDIPAAAQELQRRSARMSLKLEAGMDSDWLGAGMGPPLALTRPLRPPRAATQPGRLTLARVRDALEETRTAPHTQVLIFGTVPSTHPVVRVVASVFIRCACVC